MTHAVVAALPLPAGMLRRAVLAGSAWGLFMGALLTAVNAWNCGVVCIPDAMVTTGLAMLAGVCTLGPLAACAPRAR